MFTKKKIAILVIVSAVFLIVDWWMFSSLKKSFRETMLADQKQLVTALARSVPAPADGAAASGEEPDAALATAPATATRAHEPLIDAWLETAEKDYPDSGILYIRGVPGLDQTSSYTRDAAFLDFFTKNIDTDEFRKGIESASYLENYFSAKEYDLDGKRVRLVFAPVPNATGDTATGIVVFTLSDARYRSFAGLADALMIGAFVLFFVAFFIANFMRDPTTGYAVLALFIITGIFVAFPLVQALKLTFLKDGHFSFETWRTVLGNAQYLGALWGSVELGLLTATFSTIIGFLFAFAITRTTIRGKKFLSFIATMPVISPPFSLTLSIILLFGNNGLITNQLLHLKNVSIYGLWGLAVVQTVSMFPIAFMTLSGVLQSIDSTYEEASLDLNAGRWKTFRSVTLPLATPGVMSAWLLVFTNSLADFANPLLLAGNFHVLSVESYIEVTGMNRLGNGSALSILLLLPTLTAFFAERYWVGRKSFVTVTGKPSGHLSDLVSPRVRGFLVGFIALVVVFVLGLYGTIVAGCFVKNWGIDYTFTLSNIVEALERGKAAFISTTTLAAIATPIAGILAMVAAVLVVRKRFPGKKFLEALIMTPYAVPGTLIGISYILAFNQQPFLLVGTGAILVINYVIRELPVGMEGGVAVLRQIDPAIEEAASDLGADSATVFRTVVMPLIRPAFISSMSYTFVRSMTAVSAIIFLISARWYHITIQIYNFSENIRFGLASVLSTALIILVLAVFGLMRLLVRQSEYLEKTVSIQ